MASRDYYEILGVERNATPEQIKKAYRTLARKHHPDVNPGDKKAEALFKEAQGAYDVLSDAEKRSLYDRYGMAAFEGMAASGPRTKASEWSARVGPGEAFDFTEFFGPGFHPTTGQAPGPGTEEGLGGGLFDDLLGRIRGGRGHKRPPQGPRKGRSVETHLSIPFLTAVLGGETTIEIKRDGGKSETLVVKIPPGTETGHKLRLRGRGEPGEGSAPAGDLTIEVAVEPHPYYTREGRDLYVEVPVTIGEAVLGARVDVPTPKGTKTITIPPGSSSGQKLRVRGQGVPAHGSKPESDLFVVLKIVVPKTMDEQSRALIKEFAERNPQNPREGLW